MSGTDWIIQLAEEESLWMEKRLQSSGWPSPIVCDYLNLRKLAAAGNVYGSLLQIRDLYEISIKMPVLMALIYMDQKSGDHLTEDLDFLQKLIEKPLSMGDWLLLSRTIRKLAEKYRIPAELQQILKNTEKLFQMKVGDLANAVNWRNETIGHGALKAEDSEDYRKEFADLLKNYAQYAAKDEAFLSAYDSLFFTLGDFPLTGDTLPEPDSNAAVKLNIAGEALNLGKYAADRLFFWDSFYFRKRKIKYTDCCTGAEKMTQDNAFEDYIAALLYRKKGLDRSVDAEIIRREEEDILKSLSRPERYVEPGMLIKQLNEEMDRLEKGLILLFMERGTGKTAFVNRLDGLYNDSSDLVEGTVIRTYTVSDAMIRGTGDFFGSIETAFARGRSAGDDIRRKDGASLPVISREKNPQEAMAEFLNEYRKIYEEKFYTERLMLVIDGLDEAAGPSTELLKYIPEGSLLDEGVFVLCTSRFPEEPGIPSEAAWEIPKIRERVDAEITLRRNSPEYEALLEAYAAQTAAIQPGEALSKLISLADHRMLYLKAYLPLQAEVTVKAESAEQIFNWYLDSLLGKYDGKSGRKLITLLTAIAAYGELSIREYFDFVSGDELTYGFIGRLNDLMPVLSSRGSDQGRQYFLANEVYRDCLFKRYPEELTGQMRQFQENYREWGGFHPDPPIEEPDEAEITPDEPEAEADPNRFETESEFWKRIESQNRETGFRIRSLETFRVLSDQYDLNDIFYEPEFLKDAAWSFMQCYSLSFQSSGNVRRQIGQLEKTVLQILITEADREDFGPDDRIGVDYHILNAWLYSPEYHILQDKLLEKVRRGENFRPWIWVLLQGEQDIPEEYRDNGTMKMRKEKAEKVTDAFYGAGKLSELLPLLEPDGLSRPDMEIITYIPHLERILQYPDLDSETEARVLNTLALSWLEGRKEDSDYPKPAQRLYRRMEEKGYAVHLPEGRENVRKDYENCLRGGIPDTEEVCRDFEEMVSEIFEKKGFLGSGQMDRIRDRMTDEKEENRAAAWEFLKRVFEGIDTSIEENRSELPGILHAAEMLMTEFFQDYFKESARETALRWKSGIMNLQDTGVTRFRHSLYSILMRETGTKTPEGRELLSEYVRNFDAEHYMEMLWYGRMDNRPDAAEMRGSIVATDNSVRLMRCLFEEGKQEEAGALAEEIYSGTCKMEKMMEPYGELSLFDRADHYYIRYVFTGWCREFQFGDIARRRFPRMPREEFLRITAEIESATQYTDFRWIDSQINRIMGTLFQAGQMGIRNFGIVPLIKQTEEKAARSSGELKKELEALTAKLKSVEGFLTWYIDGVLPEIPEETWIQLGCSIYHDDSIIFFREIYEVAYLFYQDMEDGRPLNKMRYRRHDTNPEISII